jgi:hypothetical protein
MTRTANRTGDRAAVQNRHRRSSSSTARRRAAAGVGLGLLLATATAGCTGGPSPALTRLSEARRLSAEFLVHFTKAADAANRAVMADTDEASVAFARDARQERRAAEDDIGKLQPLVEGLELADELKVLAELRNAFAKYRALDEEVLGLASENTNLKAQRLSFGPAREAADAFRAALDAVAHAAGEDDACRVQALSSAAALAVREIQVLEAPHIAAADDAAMTAFEQQMATLEAQARSTLTQLAGLAPELQSASAALDRFMSVHAQLVTLSRRNSNVRSLALSLGQKRTLSAACEESIQALRARLEKRAFTGTR